MALKLNPLTAKFDMVVDKAADVSILDSGGFFTGINVEAALQEIADGTTLDSRYVLVTGDTMQGNLNMGGFSFIGGEAAGGDLTLDSTSSATKGSIFLGESLEIAPDGTFSGSVGTILWPRSGMYEQTGGVPRFFFKPAGDRFEVLDESGSQFLMSVNGVNSAEPRGVFLPDGIRTGVYQSTAQDIGGALFSGNVGIGTGFSSDPAEALLHVRKSTSGFGFILESLEDNNSLQRTVGVLKATSTTGTPSDGFGPSILFQIETSAGSSSFIGRYSVVRDGSSSKCQHKWFSGSNTDLMTLRSSGFLGIGRDDPNSILHVEGTSAFRRIRTAGGLTMSDSLPATFYAGVASGGNRTISLPASSTEDRIYGVKRIDDVSSNTLTFNGNGNDIDGDSSILVPIGHSFIVQGDGSNWEIVASHEPHNKARITSTDSPYTLPVGIDEVFADTDGGAITINLYAGASNKRPIRIINTGSSGNDVTVDGDGAETVRGAANDTITDGSPKIYSYQATEGWW